MDKVHTVGFDTQVPSYIYIYTRITDTWKITYVMHVHTHTHTQNYELQV